jgi:hypothetical protein
LEIKAKIGLFLDFNLWGAHQEQKAQRMSKIRTCDFNSLIIIANIAVCAVAMTLYGIFGGNPCVDIRTLILLCIFGIENIVMLVCEKKRRDPFVIFLMVIALFFYMGRVATLLYVPPLFVAFTSVDLNASLIFIMFANMAIFLGLSAAGTKIFYRGTDAADRVLACPGHVIAVLLGVMALSSWIRASGGTDGGFRGYLSMFTNPNLIALCTVIYIAVNFSKFTKRTRNLLFGVVVFFMLWATFNGSRSALLNLSCYFLAAFLSLKGRVLFSKKAMLIGLIMIPIAFYFFIAATYIRQSGAMLEVEYSKKVSILKKGQVFGSRDVRQLSRPLLERIGFLDFAALLISDPQRYRKIINFQYYFDSILDNVLSPGFNLTDTTTVSHSLGYVTRGEGLPLHEQVSVAYQSDMPTVYGENFVLFYGYPALTVLFVMAFIFKKIYLSIRNNDVTLFYLHRALVLYVFYLWINSFGLDWMLFDLVGIIVTIALFQHFYKMRKPLEVAHRP